MFKGLVFLSLLALSFSASAAKTFVYCSEGSPTTMNPIFGTDGATFNATAVPVFNTLVDFKPGTTIVQPSLAESWTVSKDGLAVTFKLRKGVKFHSNEIFKPTRDLNADDVIYTFNRQRLANHPYNKVSGGNYEYFISMDMQKIIKDIQKVDELTVKFILTQKEAPFIANMGMSFASILSAEYADAMLKAKTPEKADNLPIGTGPFTFVSYQKDTLIRFKAFDQYWKGRVKIDNLVFAITTDASVRFQKLKAGECHLVAEPAPQDIDAMKKNPKLAVQEKEGLNIGYLGFNMDKAPFNKLEVRQAINHALNRASYIDAIYMGRAMVAKNPIPPTLWAYNNSTKDYDYNPVKAKELLKKAGLPDGFETELWTLPVSRPYNPAGKKMGEMMQADLAKVGIKVKLLTYDWPTYIEKSKKGEHKMIQFGWTGDNGDPDNFLYVLLSCAGVKGGTNMARFCYQPFESLIDKAKQDSNQKKRTELYLKAQTIFKEQAPWATIAHAKTYRAMAANVTGYVINPLGTENFDSVDLK